MLEYVTLLYFYCTLNNYFQIMFLSLSAVSTFCINCSLVRWTLQLCKKSSPKFPPLLLQPGSAWNTENEITWTYTHICVCTKYVMWISTSIRGVQSFLSVGSDKPTSFLHSNWLEWCNSSPWWPALITAGSLVVRILHFGNSYWIKFPQFSLYCSFCVTFLWHYPPTFTKM